MASIELICDNCGAANPQGAEFCQNCKSFLAWDRTTLTAPAQPRPSPGPSTAQPGAGRPVAPQPAASGQPPASTQGAAATQHAQRDAGWARFCTWCGAGNPAGRHLCRRCGLLLDPNDAWATVRPAGGAPGGSGSAAGSAAYERSVPGWYRLRGLIAAVGVLAMVAGIGGLVWANPVGRTMDVWASLNRQVVGVRVAGVTVEPAAAVIARSKPAAVIDDTVEELSLNWASPANATCGASDATWIVLRLAEPARIQRIMVYPGLHGENPLRGREPVPSMIGIQFDAGACATRSLSANAQGWATIADLDSGQAVSAVRISVLEAGTSTDAPLPRVSLTEIKLFTYQ